jgi:hypothetical protein
MATIYKRKADKVYLVNLLALDRIVIGGIIE